MQLHEDGDGDMSCEKERERERERKREKEGEEQGKKEMYECWTMDNIVCQIERVNFSWLVCSNVKDIV